eukprot:11211608-Prorocentrum_lima.AAC.1
MGLHTSGGQSVSTAHANEVLDDNAVQVRACLQRGVNALLHDLFFKGQSPEVEPGCLILHITPFPM